MAKNYKKYLTDEGYQSLNNMGTKELEKAVKALQKEASMRRKSATAAMKKINPNFKNLDRLLWRMKQKPNESLNKYRNRVLHRAAKLADFLSQKTTTRAGARDFVSNMSDAVSKIIGEKISLTPEQANALGKIIGRTREASRGLPFLQSSERIIDTAYRVYKDTESNTLSKSDIEELLQNEIEKEGQDYVKTRGSVTGIKYIIE